MSAPKETPVWASVDVRVARATLFDSRESVVWMHLIGGAGDRADTFHVAEQPHQRHSLCGKSNNYSTTRARPVEPGRICSVCARMLVYRLTASARFDETGVKNGS
jgi:hypothetical protein